MVEWGDRFGSKFKVQSSKGAGALRTRNLVLGIRDAQWIISCAAGEHEIKRGPVGVISE